MAPSIKFTYFPFAMRGEATRLALHIGGVPFEDERLSFEQFGAAREAGTFPFRSLPILTVDGEVFAESNALLRFAGRLGGLYPKCEKDAMKVDMVVDAVETLVNALFKDSSAEGRKEFIENAIPRYVGAINKMYAATEGPFLLGETMTVADVKLAGWASWMNSGKPFEHIPEGSLEKYSNVMAASKAVMSNEKVKEWYAKH